MEIGQLVKLKSPFKVPIMQVRRVSEVPESLKVDDNTLQDEITCFWFDNNNAYIERTFDENELVIHSLDKLNNNLIR